MYNNSRHLVEDIFSILCNMSSSKYANYYKNEYYNTDLSKQAKKEKALGKKVISNWKWENERK